MVWRRVIPSLLLKGDGFVKTFRFDRPRYLGDPINIVRLFNDKEADELLVLDITATRERRGPHFELLEELASECFMPLGYGGGVRSIDDMGRLFGLGIEKVAINTCVFDNPNIVTRAAEKFGAQSVVVSMDVKRKLLGRYEVRTESGRRGTGRDPVEYARDVERFGAGELLVNCIDRDGMQQGYDVALLRRVADAVSIPVIACGGARGVEDLGEVVREGGVSAVAGGSMFVFQGPHRAVLISVPTEEELERQGLR